MVGAQGCFSFEDRPLSERNRVRVIDRYHGWENTSKQTLAGVGSLHPPPKAGVLGSTSTPLNPYTAYRDHDM